jgi:hypothetical protein
MGRIVWFRRLAHGASAGVLLSCLRAPLGLDWTQLVVTSAASALLFRAAALLALALSLDSLRPAFHAGVRATWLAAVAAGFALHALVLDVTPDSRAGYALLLVAGTVLLRALAGPRRAIAGAGPADAFAPFAPFAPFVRGERLGLVLVGFGGALALETLARELRLFGLGLRADDALAATVFLVLLALAAAAFGPLAARAGAERVRTLAGLGLSAGACLAGLLFLAQLSPDGLFGYLQRFDFLLGPGRALDARLGGRLGLAALPALDGSSIGTLWTGGVIAAATLIAPAFVLGATLGSTRNASRLGHALAGAALGLVLLPVLVRAHGRPLQLADLGGASFAWDLVAAGALVAALGVLAPALAPALVHGRGRAASVALAAAVALLPWIRPRVVGWSFSPWAPQRIDPELVWPTPEGLLTVERARDGIRILTLDRRRLTPTGDEEEHDATQLSLAFALLPPERRAGPVRTLLIGQLTPARAAALASLGIAELDRSAPWHAAMERVEALLFEGGPVPAGRILAPGAARAGLGDGRYDWVVAPGATGPILSWRSESRALWGAVDAPRLTDLELDEGTVGVAWLTADSAGERGAELAPLLVGPGGLETLALGLVRGGPRDPAARTGPLLGVSSFRGPSPLDVLRTMPSQRAFDLQRAWTASLAPEPAPEIARALALHFAAQRLSSPFETRAQQIEIDEDALRAFFAAVPSEQAGLDAFTRSVWSALAHLVTEKRLPELALVYLEPVAERFAPWPELDRAVAIAYREVLDPAGAQPFLARARAAEPYDIGLLVESARCASDLGDTAGAVELMEQALALQPGRPDLERELGLLLVRAGEPRGQALLERWLGEHPDDPEVLEALGRELPR